MNRLLSENREKRSILCVIAIDVETKRKQKSRAIILPFIDWDVFNQFSIIFDSIVYRHHQIQLFFPCQREKKIPSLLFT